MTPILQQHRCPGTRREVAPSSLPYLTGGTGCGGVELGSGKVSGGQEVAEPEGKRLKNAWEFPQGGVWGLSRWRRCWYPTPWDRGGNGVTGVRSKKPVCCLPSACRQLRFWVLTPPLHPRLNANTSAPSLGALLKQLQRLLGGEKRGTGRSRSLGVMIWGWLHLCREVWLCCWPCGVPLGWEGSQAGLFLPHGPHTLWQAQGASSPAKPRTHRGPGCSTCPAGVRIPKFLVGLPWSHLCCRVCVQADGSWCSDS